MALLERLRQARPRQAAPAGRFAFAFGRTLSALRFLRTNMGPGFDTGPALPCAGG